MTRIRKQLNKLLIPVLAIAMLCSSFALAAGSCGLHIYLYDSNDTPEARVNVELFQVASYDGGAYSLTTDFSALSVSAADLAADPGTAHAELVYQYVHAYDLAGIRKVTNLDGLVSYTGLDAGVYLVMERGRQGVAFAPYLVVLPARINGVLHSVVTSIPKTSDTDTNALSVIKLWNDNNDAAGKRPSNLEITLLRDGVPFRKVTLNESNSWQHTFYMLPDSSTYTAVEESISNYELEQIPVMEGWIFLNTYIGGATPPPTPPPTPPGGGGGGGGILPDPDPEPKPAHVSVTKVWDDDNDAAGERPSSVVVQLIEDGTIIRTVSLRSSNFWSHTFKNLDSTKTYTVQEIAVENYTASYQGNASTGIQITNTYTGTTEPGTPPPPIIPEPALIDIPVRVDWVDENNEYNTRPEEVTVHLLSGGSIMGTLQIHAGNNANKPASLQLYSLDGDRLAATLLHYSGNNSWYGIFKGVPADLGYSVWETPVPDYSTSYSGSASAGFVITNVYTEGVTDPGVPPEPTLPIEPEPIAPVDPNIPLVPPESTETPTEPGPLLPQTGAQVFPVYLLMAAGVLLVLLGLLDLYKGREDS